MLNSTFLIKNFLTLYFSNILWCWNKNKRISYLQECIGFDLLHQFITFLFFKYTNHNNEHIYKINQKQLAQPRKVVYRKLVQPIASAHRRQFWFELANSYRLLTTGLFVSYQRYTSILIALEHLLSIENGPIGLLIDILEFVIWK